MNPTTSSRASAGYVAQAVISFGIALAVVIVGELRLPADSWIRAFLAIGTLFLVSSSFTLAKVIRDQHESENVVSRIDQARLERLLAEFDPYRFQAQMSGVADLAAPPPNPPYVNAN